MLTRAIRVAAIGFVCVFATLGALDTSVVALLGWCVLGLIIGAVVAIVFPRNRTWAPDPRTGALAAAGFVALSLAVTGMLATLGGGLTAAVLAVFGLAALVAGLRRRPVPRVGPAADDVIAAVTQAPQARPVAELSTDELCTAWRRSYFQLLVARDAPTRRGMVERRQDYLDELERRDRSGFVRWLASGARAGGDPGPYLTTRR